MHDKQTPFEIDAKTGLPIGPVVKNLGPAKLPERKVLEGDYCRLEPLALTHTQELFEASVPSDAAARFRYMADAPPEDLTQFEIWMKQAIESHDPLFFAVIDKRTGRVEGRQTLMRITPSHQSIEIGNIYWGSAISRTPVTTEANFLFAQYIFEELGFRRFEWKCDSLNAPSRKAAERFGFQYEGHFRRAVIIRSRTRDTSWFSIIDDEWPRLKNAYQQWLCPANFDSRGQQLKRLDEFRS